MNDATGSGGRGGDIPPGGGRPERSGWPGHGRRPVLRHAARGRTARRRTTALAVGAALCAVVLTACGVRTTSVPVDAGAAPSRLPCDVDRKDTITPPAPGGMPVRVYLVCASQLTPVERPVHVPAGARVTLAQALLDELQARPSADEHQAGFTTYVRSPLSVTAGRPGDPTGVLRLSAQPENLPQSALAQIVCTLVDNGINGADALGRAGSGTAPGAADQVALAGPGAYVPRAYTCDSQVKADPDAPVPAAAPGSGETS